MEISLEFFFVTTLRVVWIEIVSPFISEMVKLSPPCGWCGLKCNKWFGGSCLWPSPPCGWCGLKSFDFCAAFFSTCHHLAGGVDWNSLMNPQTAVPRRHHLAGGVDWNRRIADRIWEGLVSPPCGWCGLKFIIPIIRVAAVVVTTLRVVWIEIYEDSAVPEGEVGHHLAGGVDWNCVRYPWRV